MQPYKKTRLYGMLDKIAFPDIINKMNKKLLIGIIIFLLLVGAAGAGWFFTRKNLSPAIKNQEAVQPKKDTSVFSSIQDALSKSLSLECQFSDDQQRKTIAHIKNGQIRVDITASDPKQSGSVIVKDKKMYYWTMAKQGYMMDLSSIHPTGTQATNGANQQQNVMSTMDKYKDDCKTASVADSWFVLPTGITFTDFSKMMPSGMMQPSGMVKPSGTMPSGVPTQYQQQMQQYMQQQKSSGQ